MVTGTLFVEGARTVIQTEQDRQKLTAAGVAFWLGAAFQFDLFTLPNAHPVLDALLSSGVTTGGLAIVAMVLFLELTGQRRMRFRSQLDIEALPDLNAFMARFAARSGWNTAMVDRLNAVAEETLLTLAPLDLDLEADENGQSERGLVDLASRDGPEAELEFIGGGNDENLEDRIRQLQQHDSETPVEREISLQLLRHFASSVQPSPVPRHRGHNGTRRPARSVTRDVDHRQPRMARRAPDAPPRGLRRRSRDRRVLPRRDGRAQRGRLSRRLVRRRRAVDARVLLLAARPRLPRPGVGLLGRRARRRDDRGQRRALLRHGALRRSDGTPTWSYWSSATTSCAVRWRSGFWTGASPALAPAASTGSGAGRWARAEARTCWPGAGTRSDGGTVG